MRHLATSLPVLFAISWLVKSTLLLALALGAAALLRRAPAGTRHMVWLAALAGVVLLPIIDLWSPVRLRVLPAAAADVVATSDVPPAAPIAAGFDPSPTRTTGRALVPNEKASAASAAAGATEGTPTPSRTLAPPPTRAVGAVAEGTFPLGIALAALLAAGATILLAWLALGARAVRRIVAEATPLTSAEWTAALCESADRLDLEQTPRLVASDRVEMPFACGLRTPTIVLPASAASWSEDRRRAVLFHELAHVRRRDLLGHTLGRVVCALYWFHPLVWTAARRLRSESERACDDLVLACGARASDYADHLLDLVVGARHQGAPAPALPMARRRELEGRVLAILDPAMPRSAPGRGQRTLAAGAVLAAAAIAGMLAPAPAAGRVLPPNEPEVLATDVGPSLVRQAPAAAPRTPAGKSAAAATTADAPATVPREPEAGAAPDPLPATGVDVRAVVGGALRDLAIQLSSQDGGAVPATRGDSERVLLLARLLRTDSKAEVRKTAAWALSRASAMPAASSALIEALAKDESEEVREMAAWSLARARTDASHAALATAVASDRSEEVRETAVWALGDHGVAAQAPAVTRALGDPSEAVRESAAWALGEMRLSSAPPALVAALGDSSREVRERAAWAIAEIHDASALGAVRAAFLRERDRDARMMQLRTLTLLGDDSPQVRDAALASEDPEVRAIGVRLVAGLSRSWPAPEPGPRPRPEPEP